MAVIVIIFKEGDVLNLRNLRDAMADTKGWQAVYISIFCMDDVLKLPGFVPITLYRGVLPKFVGEVGAIERAVIVLLECLDAPEGALARERMAKHQSEHMAALTIAWQKQEGYVA